MRPTVESQLRSYFEQVEESHGPLTNTAILERAPRIQVIPRPRPATMPAPRFWRWAWVVATLILFAGIAILLAPVGSDEAPPADEPTTTSVPTSAPTTAPPPGLLEAGTLDTSIGAANWWTVSGADGALPASGGWLFQTPAGYEMIVGFAPEAVQYWTSPDGMAWRQDPLPDGLAGLEGQGGVMLRYVGDESWLVTGSGAWVRDGEEWRGFPFPTALVGPQLGGIGDEVWLTSTSPPGIWRLDGDTWTSFDPGVAAADLNELAVFVGGRAVGANGTVVVPWDADTLTVIDPGGAVDAVIPPWAAQIDQANGAQSDELTVFANDERFVAIVVDWMPGSECPPTRPDCETPPDTNVITVWTSDDGVTWEGPGQPGFLPEGGDGLGTYVSFSPVGGFLFAGVQDSQGSSQLWFSADGLGWELSGIPFIGSLSFDPVEPGWIYFDSGLMYTSPDLRQWESVTTPPGAALGDAGGSIMWASSGSAFYVYQAPEGGDPTLWVADFGG